MLEVYHNKSPSIVSTKAISQKVSSTNNHNKELIKRMNRNDVLSLKTRAHSVGGNDGQIFKQENMQ